MDQAMNRRQITILIGSFALASLAAEAQSWCPPGARWVYNSSDPILGASYNSFTYAGDTVVDGHAAQRIEQHGAITQIWGSDTLIETGGPDIVTRTEPGIVLWWLADLQEWDTLYWFGAAVGDRWSPGWQQGTAEWTGVCDEGTYLTVLGTSSTAVDGVALGTLAMGVMHDGSVVDMFTIVERMGNTTGYFIPRPTYCIVDECLCSFLCYRDDQITSPSGGPCALPLAVPEVIASNAPNVWSVAPMPFTDCFTVQVSSPVLQGEVSLLDLTGRMLKRMAVTGTSVLVDGSGLPVGPYILRIKDGHGQLHHQRVIKQ